MTKRQSKVMRSFQIKMIKQLATGEFKSIILKNELFVKWLVGYMAANQIAFKLIPYGEGVTRITLDAISCPLCEGSGIIPEKSCHNEREEPYMENHFERLFNKVTNKNIVHFNMLKMAS